MADLGGPHCVRPRRGCCWRATGAAGLERWTRGRYVCWYRAGPLPKDVLLRACLRRGQMKSKRFSRSRNGLCGRVSEEARAAAIRRSSSSAAARRCAAGLRLRDVATLRRCVSESFSTAPANTNGAGLASSHSIVSSHRPSASFHIPHPREIQAHSSNGTGAHARYKVGPVEVAAPSRPAQASHKVPRKGGPHLLPVATSLRTAKGSRVLLEHRTWRRRAAQLGECSQGARPRSQEQSPGRGKGHQYRPQEESGLARPPECEYQWAALRISHEIVAGDVAQGGD